MNRWISLIVLAAVASVAMGAGPLQDSENVGRLDGYKLLRAYPQSWGHIEQLHDLGALLHSDYEGIGPVDYLVPPEAMAGLDALGVSYDVLKDDVQKDIDAERRRLEAQGPIDPRGRGWYDDFKDLDQILDKLQAWVVDYPDLTELIDIGDSIEGRDIWALSITGPGENKPGVLFNATQHAREWIVPMVDLYVADYLLTQYGVDPEITALVDAVKIWFIPVVNPDGYVYSWLPGERYWRKNRRDNEGSNCFGVDLNRNWELGWGGSGSSGDPCSETYRGTGPFSEPETQAMEAFYIAHPNLVASIDLHSYGEYILYPWAYKSGPCDDDGVHDEVGIAMQGLIAAVHGHNYMVGSIYDDLYPAAGGGVDWTWGDQGVLSYTFELRGPDFVIPPTEIIPNSEEILPAALYLVQWSSSPVKFSFPDGLPTQLEAGVETDIALNISVWGGSSIEPGTEKLFYRVGSDDPFTEQVLTPLGGEDYQATLPALNVGQTIQFYFQAQTTDNAVYTSPIGAPDVVYEAGVVEVYYRWNLDENPDWSTEGQWAWGQPTGQGGAWGHPDPTSGYTGENVCGYNLNGDYSTNVGGPYFLTTGAIDCSDLTRVTLRFRRWLNSDYQPYVYQTVEVSNDGSNWVQIWSNGSNEIAENSWSEHEYDISDLADEQPTFFVRWGHEIGSSGAWAYSGWNIDDIEIRGIGVGPCHGDVNEDGIVDIDDLFAVLAHWGEGAGPYDLNEDGTVDIDDLFEVLASWGPC